ncbi:fungal-specific transcription factor domain-containing protein, partial [Thermothelomyces heterothallicus CBS 202.75]|uniref:fungal-specific transcription factor domain-containing protein n=1 Tax=Thermothelomyces heterothallicus CBS 202.75 TaxID=1149848 RepID=UPI003743C35F
LADAQRTFQREHQKALEPFVVHVESVVPIQKRMAGILPPRPACDRLVDFYFSVLETMFPIVHKPSFGREYKKYWGGNLENDAFLPRLLCILCFASRFCTGTQSHCSIHIPTACVLVRDWLDGLRKREVFDPYILQTELLLLLAQWTIGTQKGAAWAQLSYVVRMAMELGLHQDPSGLAGISEFNMECRRRLWFAIMEMDFYVSLAHNWTPVLGHKDYSCNPPRNLNNADMPADARTLPESKPLDQATDNHLQAYAAQTFPLRMQAADLLARLDPADDHGEILDVGAKLEKMLDDINKTFPRHVLGKGHKHREWRRRVLLDLHLRLPLMALYRPMVVGRPNCSPEISCGYLKCCMTVLKYLDDEPIGDHVGSPDVAALSLLFLQRALTEAACDVCWYIKQAREINFAGGLMWIPPTGSRRRNAESTQQYVWYVKVLSKVLGLCDIKGLLT